VVLPGKNVLKDIRPRIPTDAFACILDGDLWPRVKTFPQSRMSIWAALGVNLTPRLSASFQMTLLKANGIPQIVLGTSESVEMRI